MEAVKKSSRFVGALVRAVELFRRSDRESLAEIQRRRRVIARNIAYCERELAYLESLRKGSDNAKSSE